MAQYKVLSHRVAGAKQGATLSTTDLEGANIEALIEAGHIADISKVSKKQDQPKVEE